MDEEILYEGTRFKKVPTSEACSPEITYILGIVDTIAGTEFGTYANIGVIESHPR